MKKFLMRCALCVLLNVSACSLMFKYPPPIPPTFPEDFNVLSFIEGKFSEVDGWKISSSNVVNMTTPTEIDREFVEVVDDLTLIYKNEVDGYFKMKVNYYTKHGDYLFWSSQAVDSLSAAREIEVTEEECGYFVVDEFLEEVEGKGSINYRIIINGDIVTGDYVYFEYVKNIDEITAIYGMTTVEMYAKFILNEDKTEFLFKASAYYSSIEDAEDDNDVEKWEDFFSLTE